jgi:hypothetical protein
MMVRMYLKYKDVDNLVKNLMSNQHFLDEPCLDISPFDELGVGVWG